METILAIATIAVFLGILWVVKSIHDEEVTVKVKPKEQKEIEALIKQIEEGESDVKEDWHKHISD